MKDIRLVYVHIHNFKGITDREINFKDSLSEVSGDNGTGKTTIADAVNWCLWGKDSNDRKDYCIVPRGKDGEEQHNLETIVSTCWSVTEGTESKEVFYSRRYEEKYTYGAEGEQVLKGHESTYYINKAPRKMSEFKDSVSELFGTETHYRSFTDPFYFPVITNWKDRRDILLKVCGCDKTDEELAKGYENFERLLQIADGRTVETLRKDTVSARNKAKVDIETLKARIDQTKKLMPEHADIDEAKVADLQSQLEEVERQLQTPADIRRRELQARLNDISYRLEVIEINTKSKARTEIQEKQDSLSKVYHKKNDEYNTCASELAILNTNIERKQTELSDLKVLRDAKRAEWHNVNEAEYNGSDECPVCHQRLPQAMIQEAMDNFYATKSEHLQTIQNKGKEVAINIEKLTEEIKNLQDEKGGKDRKASDLLLEATNAKTAWEVAKDMKPVIDLTGNSEYNDLKAQQTTLKGQIAECKDETPSTDLLTRKEALTAELKEYDKARINNETITRYEKELTELEQEFTCVKEHIAECIKIEDTIKQYYQHKVDIIGSTINKCFANIKFRLFEVTLEGNITECCTPLVHGVPFEAANTASQINAGIEIITMLNSYEEVNMPIWIDNAESVNKILETDAQQIRLTVSKDKELTVK